MGELRKLADHSHDGRHADVVDVCERMLEKAKSGEVSEVFLIYTTDDGETMNHLTAGANHFRVFYIVSRMVQYLLHE
jgi:hypothetical protein